MALITISETARLTGKNRTTIYKYINNGKLSVVASVDGVKKKKLDGFKVEPNTIPEREELSWFSQI